MRLILVRHGETEYNSEGRQMGQLNIGLNKLGKEQAIKLAQRLIEHKIDFIYSSDLKRCLDTLEQIVKHHTAPVTQVKELRERHLGVFQGMRSEEIDWDRVPGSFISKRPHQGESLLDLKSRIKKFLNHLESRHRGETVLLVTHGGVMRMLHHLLTRESLEGSVSRFKYHNTAVCIYEVTGRKPDIICFNDISHL